MYLLCQSTQEADINRQWFFIMFHKLCLDKTQVSPPATTNHMPFLRRITPNLPDSRVSQGSQEEYLETKMPFQDSELVAVDKHHLNEPSNLQTPQQIAPFPQKAKRDKNIYGNCRACKTVLLKGHQPEAGLSVHKSAEQVKETP